MEGGTREVGDSVSRAKRAGQSLGRITTSIEKVNQIIGMLREQSAERQHFHEKVAMSTGDIAVIQEEIRGLLQERRGEEESLERNGASIESDHRAVVQNLRSLSGKAEALSARLEGLETSLFGAPAPTREGKDEPKRD
jgi:chromosome segregation ATPase